MCIFNVKEHKGNLLSLGVMKQIDELRNISTHIPNKVLEGCFSPTRIYNIYIHKANNVPKCTFGNTSKSHECC